MLVKSEARAKEDDDKNNQKIDLFCNKFENVLFCL
jgi:hypothetical protein